MFGLRLLVNDSVLVGMSADLERYAQQTSSIRQFWPAAERAAREVVGRAFSSEGADTRSGAWPALSEQYARWKAANFPGASILVREGRLRRSLVEGTADSSVEVTDKRMTITSTVPYGGYHQRGEGGNKKRSPWDPRDVDVFAVVSAVRNEIHKIRLSKLQAVSS